jgi:hypothetical protein
MDVHPVLRGSAVASQLQLLPSGPDGQPTESSHLGLKQPALLGTLDDLASLMTVASVASLAPLLPEGEAALKNSVPSRNGSTRDAHLLALAWSAGADIWTHDRDFAGTGVATWSTTNLMRALATAQG